ncbi:anthranilate synthase component I family protein [Paenibacillus herberti]|uniref:Anthranilate synthase component I n=1 Tax=Paenibacillus herberti TaxID=1619309 RepID=A0A229NXX3_9BACL|nr:anthranilate synthase component I family protein [Paenibacillus herberti]OXM14595.1 anthranilate synthase component I [Paenibacillus herberti]
MKGSVCTSWEQWQEWLEQHETTYTTLPVLARVDLADGHGLPSSWEEAWRAEEPYSILLESGKSGRYTYLGRRPSAVLRGKGDSAELLERGVAGGYEPVRRIEADPLEAVRHWMEGWRGPRIAGGPKWTGGSAGFWSYDVARSIERLPELAEDDLRLPDYLFLRLDEVWIYDRQEACLYAAVHRAVDSQHMSSHRSLGAVRGAEALDPTEAGEQQSSLPLEASSKLSAAKELYDAAAERAQEMLREWADWAEAAEANGLTASRRGLLERSEATGVLPFPDVPENVSSPFQQEQYQAAVSAIREYIAAGDVFQVNLSLRQQKDTDSSPEELYEWLRLINPSPYMGLLRAPDFQLVSASPELLVEMSDGKLYTRPIAGTRRRGRTTEEDASLERELRENEKETAEHIMLVDLERNDLGRVSRYGSVRVEELMVVERYSHVMHLVSQVNGELADGLDAYDVIRAVFPGGTITGAPKVRTMEIIEELEPTRRGPYTGSMGWIDYSGDMEFNIIIRTMAIRDHTVHIQAGAGIVIDSDPEREYRESQSKARALWRAFHYAELHRSRSNHIEAAGDEEIIHTDRGLSHDFSHRQL